MDNDTRTYYLKPEGDMLRLFIIAESGTVMKHGLYKTREAAVKRRRLENATEVPEPSNPNLYREPAAPLLRTFAKEVGL